MSTLNSPPARLVRRAEDRRRGLLEDAAHEDDVVLDVVPEASQLPLHRILSSKINNFEKLANFGNVLLITK